jgi:uncharacterized protein (TIGR02118 family)
MIQVTVMYPNTSGSRFDERYYLGEHAALLQRCWGTMGLGGVRLLRGVGTPDGGAAPYRVIALLTFESAEALQRALQAHGAEVLGDIPRFTDVQPIIQVNDMLG